MDEASSPSGSPAPPGSPAPEPRVGATAVRGLVIAAALLYWLIFFLTPHHGAWLALVLIPDEVLGSMCSGATWSALSDRLHVLLLAVFQGWLVWGAGEGLLRLLQLRDQFGTRERLAVGGFAGANLLSTWTLLVGWLVGLESRWLLVGPLFVLAAVSSVQAWRDRRRSSLFANVLLSRWRYALLPFAAVLLLGAMLPPWEFDVLEYHLQIPKEWRQAGRIGFVPHNVYGNMPLGAEMQALFAMVVQGGDEGWWWGALAGKTLTGAAAVLTAVGLWGVGARSYSERAGAVAATVFLAVPWVVHISSAGLIDIVLGGYVFLAVAAWRRGVEAAGKNDVAPWRWMLLAGYLAGGAAACKYPGVVLIVLPLAAATMFIARVAGRAVGWPRRLAWTAAVAAAAAGGGGAWYVKNAAVCGNPVYPLLYSVFGGETRTPEKDEQWRAAHRPGGATGEAYTLRAAWASVKQVGWASSWHSPLVVPLFLAALLLRRRGEPLGPWPWFVAWGLVVWWLATHRIDRFWAPLLPLATLTGGAGFERLVAYLGRNTVTAWVGANLVLLGLVVVSPGPPGDPLGDNRFFASAAALREMATPPAFRLMDETLEADQKALLIGEARPFYLQHPAVYATCFDDNPYDAIFRGTTPQQQRDILARERIAYFYIHWLEIDRYRSPGNYGYSNFIHRVDVERELVQRRKLLRWVVVDGEPAQLFQVML